METIKDVLSKKRAQVEAVQIVRNDCTKMGSSSAAADRVLQELNHEITILEQASKMIGEDTGGCPPQKEDELSLNEKDKQTTVLVVPDRLDPQVRTSRPLRYYCLLAVNSQPYRTGEISDMLARAEPTRAETSTLLSSLKRSGYVTRDVSGFWSATAKGRRSFNIQKGQKLVSDTVPTRKELPRSRLAGSTDYRYKYGVIPSEDVLITLWKIKQGSAAEIVNVLDKPEMNIRRAQSFLIDLGKKGWVRKVDEVEYTVTEVGIKKLHVGFSRAKCDRIGRLLLSGPRTRKQILTDFPDLANQFQSQLGNMELQGTVEVSKTAGNTNVYHLTERGLDIYQSQPVVGLPRLEASLAEEKNSVSSVSVPDLPGLDDSEFVAKNGCDKYIFVLGLVAGVPFISEVDLMKRATAAEIEKSTVAAILGYQMSKDLVAFDSDLFRITEKGAKRFQTTGRSS